MVVSLVVKVAVGGDVFIEDNICLAPGNALEFFSERPDMFAINCLSLRFRNVIVKDDINSYRVVSII